MRTQTRPASLLVGLALVAGLLGLAPVHSAGAQQAAECNDGIDNDADGFTDFPDDEGCLDNADNDEINPHCNDGLDNDGDGRTDYPEDRDCSSRADTTELPECSDGIDNDVDGFTDFPEDPACDSPSDNAEAVRGLGFFPVHITIRYDRQRGRFIGHLSSDLPRGCRANRLVRLKKVRPGRNDVVGSDRTDGTYRNYRWVIPKEAARGKFYAVAPEVARERKDGTSVTCEHIRSVTIRVS